MSQRPWMSALQRRHQERLRTTASEARRPVEVPGGGAAVLAVLALMFAMIASVLVFDEVQRAREGLETSGVVVNRGSGNKSTKYADVVFTTSTGRRVRASIGQDGWVEMPKVGARVRVRYVPSRPERTAVDAKRPTITGFAAPVLSLGVASLCVTFAFMTWRRTRAAGTR
ncbi:DUF3592 domain-containing protein [Actinomadura sp. WMMA1423]|uniref:DUF3592 domain-containing protein n=1 Tax=Actinomadura sp. WMMA1423 TaxID=2591108 RepID=UPI0011474925|nr:DUF3592 domain-containing protein [Actinomadura sp. WMMA1423]